MTSEPLKALEGVQRLAVIGPGLLGGSLGLALKSQGFAGKVVGIARRRASLEAALAKGCLDEGTTELAEGIAGAQLAVICTPLSTFEGIFEALAHHAPPELVTTDVGSTKLAVFASAEQKLPPNLMSRFVGAHPMAGSEHQGPEHAHADLFRGKPCVICHDQDTDPAALSLVEGLFEALGMRLTYLSAHEHDRQSAVISHLPHLAAVLLTRTAEEMGGLEIASTGFRDATRLAASNPPMRLDIIRANREQILEALRAFREHLIGVEEILEQDRSKELLELLEQAQAFRQAWLRQRFESGVDQT